MALLRREFTSQALGSLVAVQMIESFFFSSRRRHTRLQGDWSSDVCSSDLITLAVQTEIPLVKQHLCDQLWAVQGEGVQMRRVDRLSGKSSSLSLRPSRAHKIGRASCRERV